MSLKLGKQMLKLYTLASIIELEASNIGIYANFADMKTIVDIQGLLTRATRLRKNFDSYYKEHAELIGDFTDLVDEMIDKEIEKTVV